MFYSRFCETRNPTWFVFVAVVATRLRVGKSNPRVSFINVWSAILKKNSKTNPTAFSRRELTRPTVRRMELNYLRKTPDGMTEKRTYTRVIDLHGALPLRSPTWASYGQQYSLPCCAHFRFPKCVQQGRGYCWPLLALGRLTGIVHH